MILSIFSWLSVVWLAPLMCFLLRNETKFKKNLAVGVTLPYDAREDHEVLTALKSFRKVEMCICILLILISTPWLFLADLNPTLILCWIPLCIAVPYIPYVLYNKKLHKIKEQRGWLRFSAEKITVDTNTIPEIHWLSPFFFLIPLLISLLPLIWERFFWFLYVLDAAFILLFWFCYRYLYRNKSEKVDDNADLTNTLTRVRRHNWGTVWIVSSYAMATMNLGIALTHAAPLPLLFVTLAVCLIITFSVIRVEIRTRHVQEKLTAQTGHRLYVDDDDKWIWGIIYYNQQDSHTFINERVGVNVTFNLAKPLGKAIAVFSVAVLLTMPFLPSIIESSLNKPPVITYTNTEVCASSGGTQYQIPLAEIAQVQLLEGLPSDLTRVIGTELSTLLKGEFTSGEIGSIEVCLDPTKPPYLFITTDKNHRYLFGMRDSGKTRAVYEKVSDFTEKK